jgi:hypothetical protein
MCDCCGWSYEEHLQNLKDSYKPWDEQQKRHDLIFKNIPLIKPLKTLITDYEIKSWTELYPIIEIKNSLDKLPYHKNQIYVRYYETEEIHYEIEKKYRLVKSADIFEGIYFSTWIPDKVKLFIGNNSFKVPIKKNEMKFFLPIIGLGSTDIDIEFIGKNRPHRFSFDILWGNLDDPQRELLACKKVTIKFRLNGKIIEYITDQGSFILIK